MSDTAQAGENAQEAIPSDAEQVAAIAAMREGAAGAAGATTEQKPPAAKAKAAPAVDEDDEDLDDDLGDEDDDEDDEDDDDLEEIAGEPDDDEDEDDDGADDEAPKIDDKNLSSVKKAERRARKLVADASAQLAAVHRERETLRADLDEVKKFRSLRDRVRHVGLGPLIDMLITENALTPADYELAARDLYARTEAGAKDPKTRELVAEKRRQIELADEMAAIKADLKKRDEAQATQQAEEASRREGAVYLARAAKRVSDATPLAQRELAKGSKTRPRALAALAGIAVELTTPDGGLPSTTKVLRVYEKRRRAELEALGVDVDAITKVTKAPSEAKSDTKNRTLKAGENRSAATKDEAKDGDMPPEDASDDELRAWTLRKLKAGQAA